MTLLQNEGQPLAAETEEYDGNLECTLCGIVYPSKYHGVKHVYAKHTPEEKGGNPPESFLSHTDKPVTNPKRFGPRNSRAKSRAKSRAMAKVTVEGDVQYTCKTCGHRVSTSAGIRTHIKKHHPEVDTSYYKIVKARKSRSSRKPNISVQAVKQQNGQLVIDCSIIVPIIFGEITIVDRKE